ncbi:uncharacterized protein LOC100175949 [Ciona intestinalis]
MDDVGDSELLALRQAALATIGIKRSKDEGDELFNKLQPPKSSNLINLTPDPNTAAEEENQNLVCSNESNDDYDSNSEESGSDCSSSSSNSRRSSEEVSKAEEDDILNAIDQFLDGGNDTSNKKLQNKNKTKKTTKQRKKKDKVKVRKELQNKKKLDSTNPKCDANIDEKDSFQQENILESTIENNTIKPREENCSKYKQTDNVEDDKDSVHSSDLSFLTDSDNEEKTSTSTSGKDFRTNQPEVISSPTNKVCHLTRPRSRSPQKQRNLRKKRNTPEKFPDLREKLKRRGRNKHSFDRVGSGNIYVKASLLEESSTSISNKQPSLGIQLNKDAPGRIIVTRDVLGCSSSVHLKKKEREEFVNKPATHGTIRSSISSKRNKGRNNRSVVQFAPNSTITEKRQIIENLSQKSSTTNDDCVEETAFSDMSDQDFNDFEIAEEVSDMENIKEENEKLEPELTQPEPRRFVTTIKSTHNGLKISKNVLRSKGPIKDRLGLPMPEQSFETNTLPDLYSVKTDANNTLTRKSNSKKRKGDHNTMAAANREHYSEGKMIIMSHVGWDREKSKIEDGKDVSIKNQRSAVVVKSSEESSPPLLKSTSMKSHALEM